MQESKQSWQVQFHDFPQLRKQLGSLNDAQWQRLIRQLVDDLTLFGVDVTATPAGKWLGAGLAEYRYRQHPSVLVRVFIGFQPGRVIVVLGAYDKLRFTAKRYQSQQIARARKVLAEYTNYQV